MGKLAEAERNYQQALTLQPHNVNVLHYLATVQEKLGGDKLAHALDIAPVIYDERLKELHFGDWEMQAWDAIPREIFDVWAQDYANLSPPNGESFSALYDRAIEFIEKVSGHSQGKDVAIVTHGGVIRAILANALNMPLKGLFRIVVDYGSVTQISFGDTVPRVHFVNR